MGLGCRVPGEATFPEMKTFPLSLTWMMGEETGCQAWQRDTGRKPHEDSVFPLGSRSTCQGGRGKMGRQKFVGCGKTLVQAGDCLKQWFSHLTTNQHLLEGL